MWKFESATRHFQPGEGPGGGFLCGCENGWIVCSSSLYLLFIFWFFLQLASSPRRVAPALRRLARGSRLGPALGILETESWFNDEMNEHTVTPSNKYANYCWSTTNGLIFLVTVGGRRADISPSAAGPQEHNQMWSGANMPNRSQLPGLLVCADLGICKV